MRHKYDELITT